MNTRSKKPNVAVVSEVVAPPETQFEKNVSEVVAPLKPRSKKNVSKVVAPLVFEAVAPLETGFKKNDEPEIQYFASKAEADEAKAPADSGSSSVSSGESGKCDSGSASFGPNTKQAGYVDPYKIFMTEFEYDNKKYKITIPSNVDMSTLLNRANDMSPLLIDHIAKGMGSEIVTRRKKRTTGAKTARVRAVIAPKLIKQMKKDLEEEGGEVLYAWMFIVEKKNSTYHYYLLSNKVKSRLEFGTKHFMLEKKYKETNRNKAPHRIYLTGEFRVRPGILEYNLMSGTYMKTKMDKLESLKTDVKPIEERFTKALGEYFSKMQVVRLPDCQPFIPQPSKDKVLTEKEWNYVQDLFGQYTIEQTKHQEEMAKRYLERTDRLNSIFDKLFKPK